MEIPHMKKRALLVGINYEGTGYPLKGCINDVNNLKSALVDKGFTEIETIIEKEATTVAILAGLRRLVDGALPGDVLVFHYSGHGSQTFSTLEPDALDEIICPVDIDWKKNVITDNELKEIFNPVPNGVNITVLLDCCHSGHGMDHDETAPLVIPKDLENIPEVKVVKKSINERYLPPPARILNKAKKNKMVLREWSTSRDINKTALLIAGCMPNQTSADATISGVPQGAATASLLLALKNNPDISYLDLINSMNGFMSKNRFTQRPQLDGSSHLYGKRFLETWAEIADPVPVAPIPSVQPVPATPVDSSSGAKKKNQKAMIIGAVVLALVILFLVAG